MTDDPMIVKTISAPRSLWERVDRSVELIRASEEWRTISRSAWLRMALTKAVENCEKENKAKSQPLRGVK